MTDTPEDRPADTLRDRVRQAICEASGFEWDPDWQEVDEYGEVADAVLAILPAPADLAWGESLSATGDGADMRVSIDVLLPGSDTPAPLTLNRADAAMLHAQLGDALGEQQETHPATDRRERIAAAIRAESSRVDDLALADAVLPAPADRAAVLREVAEQIRQPLTPEESRLLQRTWGHVPLQELLARRIDPQGGDR
ncbi:MULTISPECIES: hypothetical protein [unclassified Streptomyces]|uniref:hypothetical protein n=1 Tax=unclassified Streptomyces TaxID=2593676 RepID=UPI00081E393B|nr:MULTISPECIES: hypothetical protein [unclassified Streptomyces]MYR30666.1 hypothetical protein [Streptomyces sp. SID4945]SCF50346.1 hypothetical protein GA0115257_12581 [Streptomyces sp. LcepLS]